MTKREQLRQQHSELYKFIEKEYPESDLFDEGQYMDINFFGDDEGDNYVSFHKSRLTIDYYDYASKRTKDIVRKLEDKFDWIEK
tara:strand:+ start:20 stop:271 length:252 start_codon:yes stop_codon:yes gene_type:complete